MTTPPHAAAEPAIKVILVDDEEDFRDPVTRFLRRRGMTVHDVGSVEELTAALPAFAPDIIVLDLNLPGESGLDAVERLRGTCGAGIIMATARRGVDDRIHGLSLGADSYLEKPLDVRELEAMIRSLWGRLAARAPAAPETVWLFSPEDWTLTAPDGLSIRLSTAEYNMITLLARKPGVAVSRDILFQALGKTASGPEDRSLDVLISRLRNKLAASEHALPLKAVRSVGYVLPEIQVRGALKDIFVP
ncbi:MAG: response regulator transcription factor [Rhodospirillaceae bacterium]